MVWCSREGPNNPEEENSVCEVYLQCGTETASERALVDLLEQAKCLTFRHFPSAVLWIGLAVSPLVQLLDIAAMQSNSLRLAF